MHYFFTFLYPRKRSYRYTECASTPASWGVRPRPQRGLCFLHPRWGHSLQTPLPPARSSGSATGLCVCVCVCVCVIRRTAGRRLLRHRGVSCRVRRLSTGLVAVVRVRPSVSLNWSSSSAPSTDACVSVAVSRSTSAHCYSDQCAQLAVVSGQWEIDLGSLLQ